MSRPLKRARHDRRPLVSVFLGNVPVEYTHDTLVEMHEAMGLITSDLVDSELLEMAEDMESRSVIVRYATEKSAMAAVDTLDGQPVASQTGDAKSLTASVSEPDPELQISAPLPVQRRPPPPPAPPSLKGRGGSISKLDWCAETDRCRGRIGMLLFEDLNSKMPFCEACWQAYEEQAHWKHKHTEGRQLGRESDKGSGKKCGPTTIYPSIYVSDMPTEYTEDIVRDLHASIGLDPDTLMAIKFLPPQTINDGTCCCICRYIDDSAANKAVESIRGKPVVTAHGNQKYLGARKAKPAKWMLERGITEH